MGTAFLYGNGGSGGTLTVTAPAGSTVSVSKDGKTKTKTAGADGLAVFKGLATGTWTVTITDGVQQASKNVTVTADYSTSITFFAATINVTYPAGSVCTATDGVTTLAAPDTSGVWACVVPNAGTWAIELENGLFNSVVARISGETYTIDKWYVYDKGKEATFVTGGFSRISSNITLNDDATYMETYVTDPGGGDARNGYFASNKAIDVTKFNTLCAMVSMINGTTGYAGFGTMNTRKTSLDASAILDTDCDKKMINISITGITSCYFGGYVYGRYDYRTHFYIHSIWLEM